MGTNNSFVRSYFGILFKIALEERGYEVGEDGRYILAEKDGKKYIIQKTCRLLSNASGIEESSVICTPAETIGKLIKRAEEMGCEPAIAFGVCKYEYRDSEIAIIPLKLWELEKKPKFISETKKGYFFNYKHAMEDTISNIILRAVINIQYDDRI